ncbi:MAG: hypothetical protein HOC20_11960 [Chloroflexi bacterium]|nr:hypothetical protein [Chloroflexota bacterium]
MTELLGSVCRELSTSLTGIKGLSGSLVLRDMEWEYDVQQDFLRTIEKQADKLSCMVDDLWQGVAARDWAATIYRCDTD